VARRISICHNRAGVARHTIRAARGGGNPWGAFVFAVFAACPARAWAEDRGALTGAELARLGRGELVVRPAAERRGRLDLMGGTSWQVIDARPEVVWSAILDTQHYRKMLPRVLEARVVTHAGDERTVFVRQGVAFVQTTYHLKLKIDATKADVRFALDDTRPHAIEAAWGFFSVRPHRGERTLLTYGIMADIGSGLIALVVRDTVQEWMLRTPWMIKRFVEGSGRWIYR
jgi:ribosome-associated toxin RatA of RatAB toxin-antitoxin module